MNESTETPSNPRIIATRAELARLLAGSNVSVTEHTRDLRLKRLEVEPETLFEFFSANWRSTTDGAKAFFLTAAELIDRYDEAVALVGPPESQPSINRFFVAAKRSADRCAPRARVPAAEPVAIPA